MQLRSTVHTNDANLNERVGNATTEYLNKYFDAYYSRTEMKSTEYFLGLNISTNSFGVHGMEESFIMTIEMEGTLSFSANKLVPSEFFIDTLLRNAFKGRNEQLYLDQLLGIDDYFLQNLTHLIIDINKGEVTESIIRDNITEIIDSTNKGINRAETENLQINAVRKKRVRVLISSLVLTFMILSCCFYAYKHLQKRKTTGNRNGDNDKEPMKVIKLPVKKKQLSMRVTQSRNDVEEIIDRNRISPTSTATTHLSPGSIADKMDRPPPSPQRSMTSQASSMFTYTDNMSRITTNNKNDVMSPSRCSHSKFSFDVPSIDLNIWRGGKQDPPAFGSDISVIENQKDLSLIPEGQGDIENEMKIRNKNGTRIDVVEHRRLSRKSRVALDSRQSQSRTSNRSETYFYNGYHVSQDHNDSEIGLDLSTSDVICDLKNLSMQIERKRNGRSSNRAANQ